MAGKPDKACQNGRGILLYNAGICQGSSDFFSFSDDYKIFALRDLKPLPVKRAIAADPDLTLPTRHFSAARSSWSVFFIGYACLVCSVNLLPAPGHLVLSVLFKKRRSAPFQKDSQSSPFKQGLWQWSQETYIKTVYMFLSYSGTSPKFIGLFKFTDTLHCITPVLPNRLEYFNILISLRITFLNIHHILSKIKLY